MSDARQRWRAFNLVYLLFYFTGWLWQSPQAIDFVAFAVAFIVFLPLYFYAYECHTERGLVALVAMEGIAWAMAPFAGVHGVFHTYACVQAAFQRPQRRGFTLIGAVTAAYAGFALVTDQPTFALVFNVVCGAVIGVACIGTADGLERERRLRRGQLVAHQQATLAERERIAHELHDLLGATLTMVALKADVAVKLLQRDPERASAEMRDVASAARSALSEIREAVYDMTATSVESEMNRARQALEAAGVALESQCEVPASLPPALAKALGLTIREATTNIVRHSQASAARIELTGSDDAVRLVVADNGVGASHAREGAGLSGLRRRVEGLGGNAQFDRDNGMQIEITLPTTPLQPLEG